MHRWVKQLAAKSVQYGHSCCREHWAYLSSPGELRTLPDKVAAHAPTHGVCAATNGPSGFRVCRPHKVQVRIVLQTRRSVAQRATNFCVAHRRWTDGARPVAAIMPACSAATDSNVFVCVHHIHSWRTRHCTVLPSSLARCQQRRSSNSSGFISGIVPATHLERVSPVSHVYYSFSATAGPICIRM